MSAKVCKCGKLTSNRDMCDGCRKKRPKRDYDAKRGKWYGYDWQQCRLRYITEHPLCERCDEMGFVEPAREVHHIIPIEVEPDLRLDWDNLMSVCIPCHRILDAEYDREHREES